MSLSVQCGMCIHKQIGPYCTAFPGLHRNAVGEFIEAPEIPDAIYVDGFDHRRPYPGDNGIRFESEPEFADYWDNTPIFPDREQDEDDELNG